MVLRCFVDMEATYAEYEEWSEDGVADTVIHQYKKALQQTAKCKSFEEALVTNSTWSFCRLPLSSLDVFNNVRRFLMHIFCLLFSRCSW